MLLLQLLFSDFEKFLNAILFSLFSAAEECCEKFGVLFELFGIRHCAGHLLQDFNSRTAQIFSCFSSLKGHFRWAETTAYRSSRSVAPTSTSGWRRHRSASPSTSRCWRDRGWSTTLWRRWPTSTPSSGARGRCWGSSTRASASVIWNTLLLGKGRCCYRISTLDVSSVMVIFGRLRCINFDCSINEWYESLTGFLKTSRLFTNRLLQLSELIKWEWLFLCVFGRIELILNYKQVLHGVDLIERLPLVWCELVLVLDPLLFLRIPLAHAVPQAVATLLE